ncbi:MAG: hypothetical protein QOG01_370 [Pseudonocardiales bacterium]|nr:hypothetical protein [Pseudonocardiales bacterium]
MTGTASIDLYWLPLGAGGRSVRWNGRLFEAVLAWREGRAAQDLYHSALAVRVPAGRFVIEMAPVWADRDVDRGVVGEGAVGSRSAGRLRLFRYEIRCWRDGRIPDVAEAVDSPQRVAGDLQRAERLLALVPSVPRPVWGRDELKAGEMWNSNSVVAWLLARSGVDTAPLRMPPAGRAPGWQAGLVVAGRRHVSADERAGAR